MAEKVIEIPGVGNVAFPDSMSDEQIVSAIRKMTPATNQFADVQSGSSTAQPTSILDVSMPGLFPSINQGIESAKGVSKAVGDFVQTGGQWVQDIPRQLAESLSGQPIPGNEFMARHPWWAAPPRQTSTGADPFQPTNTAQKVGKVGGQIGLAVGGGMAAGPTMAAQIGSGGLMGALQNPDSPYGPAAAGMAVPPAVGAVQRAIPLARALMTGKEPAIAKFDQVMAAARDVPLDDLSKADDIALRARELAGQGAKTPGRGSSMPKVLSDYIKYREQNLPMTYEVGRDFAKTAGRISASEKMATTGEMESVLAQFTDAMKTANRAGAAKVGMGGLYDKAMKEFRLAATVAEKSQVIKKWARNAALAAALGGASIGGAGLVKKLVD